MLHLEILRHDRAVRITDTTTHWTKYIRANETETISVDTTSEKNRVLVVIKTTVSSVVASLPANETVITDETIKSNKDYEKAIHNSIDYIRDAPWR